MIENLNDYSTYVSSAYMVAGVLLMSLLAVVLQKYFKVKSEK